MSQQTQKQAAAPSGKTSLRSLLPNILAVVFGLAVLLFVAAGRLDWFQAWAFILAFGGYLLFYALWASRNDPGQLNERSRTGQNTKSWDKIILTLYTILLLAMLILAGLDAGRSRWAVAPWALQILGWLGAAFAGSVIFRTVAVNTFLSRTVRIQDDRGHIWLIPDRMPVCATRCTWE